jgi:hypothetical protein
MLTFFAGSVFAEETCTAMSAVTVRTAMTVSFVMIVRVISFPPSPCDHSV